MSLAFKHREKLQILQDRSFMLRQVREFFYQKNILEVDCPALNVFPSLDPYIEPLKVEVAENDIRYLHTSPEYGMKKILSMGMEDIFQLSHVFRYEEEGKQHLTEFSMVEWYRLKASQESFIDEVIQLIELFIGKLKYNKMSYQNALLKYAKVHLDWDKNEMIKYFPQLPNHCLDWSKEVILHYIWGCYVQPQLGRQEVTVITDFPQEEAALAKVIKKQQREVSQRFEFYYHGMELGNGYNELTDPEEHRMRFIKINRKRCQEGREELPIDTTFLQALEHWLPDCFGVAVGFDRLMMLRHNKDHIIDVIPS